MREEIGSAENQSGISAKRFSKTPNNLVLSSPQSDLDVSGLITGSLRKSGHVLFQPILTNTTINQSSSFKKLMNTVMGDTEF